MVLEKTSLRIDRTTDNVGSSAARLPDGQIGVPPLTEAASKMQLRSPEIDSPMLLPRPAALTAALPPAAELTTPTAKPPSERLALRAAMQGAWATLAKNAVNFQPTVEFAGATLRVVPDPTLRVVQGALPSQKAYAEKVNKPSGKATMWIQVTGHLEGTTPPGRAREQLAGWAKNQPTSFTLQLPFVYQPGHSPSQEEIEKFVATLARPPLASDKFAAVPEGSVLTLTGDGFVGKDRRGRDAKDDSEGVFNFDLYLYRLADDQVQESLRWRRHLHLLLTEPEVFAKNASVRPSVAGVRVGSEVHCGGNVMETYKMSLVDPTGRQSHDSLLTLDIDAVRAAAKANPAVHRHGAADGKDIDVALAIGMAQDKLGWTPGANDLGGIATRFTQQFGVGVSLKAEHLTPQSPLIKDDALRQAYNQEMAARDVPVEWLQVQGAIEPGITFYAPIVSAGAVSLYGGLQAGSILRYNVISAYPGKPGQSSMGVKDELTAAGKALARTYDEVVRDPARIFDPSIPVGTEIAIERMSSAGICAGVNYGLAVAFPYGFEVAATAGVEVGTGGLADVTVVLRKVGPGRVLVTTRAQVQALTRGLGTESGHPGYISARIDTSANSLKAFKDLTPNSTLGHFFDGKLGGPIADLVDHGLAGIMTFELHSGDTSNARHENDRQFVFEQNQPGQMEALRAMFAIWPREKEQYEAAYNAAKSLGADPGKIESVRNLVNDWPLSRHDAETYGDVLTRAKRLDYTEDVQQHGPHTDLSLFGPTVYVKEYNEIEHTGSLKTAAGTYEFQRRAFEKKFQLDKNLNLKWETYAAKTDIATEKDATNFHFFLHNDDSFTSKNEVVGFKTFFDAVGAVNLSPPYANPASAVFRIATLDPILHQSYNGNTVDDVDVTIKKDGLRRLSDLDPVMAVRAFMNVSGAFDAKIRDAAWLYPPGTPERAAAATAQIEQYLAEKRRLREGNANPKTVFEQMNMLAAAYEQQFGGKLSAQAECYVASLAIATTVNQLKDAFAHGEPEPAKILKIMNDLSGRVLLSGTSPAAHQHLLWRVVATLMVVARPENVSLAKLSKTGKRANISAQSATPEETPMAVVTRFFDPQNVIDDDEPEPALAATPTNPNDKE